MLEAEDRVDVPGPVGCIQGGPLYWTHLNLAKSNMIHDTPNYSKCQRFSDLAKHDTPNYSK